MSIFTVAKIWNISCPKCTRDDQLDIAAAVWVRLCPDGTDAHESEDGDHEWNEHSGIICRACGHGGNVSDFKTGEPE